MDSAPATRAPTAARFSRVVARRAVCASRPPATRSDLGLASRCFRRSRRSSVMRSSAMSSTPSPPSDGDRVPVSPPSLEGSSPSGRNTFSAKDRVKKRPRFLEVQHRGRKIHTAHFVVTVLRRETPVGSTKSSRSPLLVSGARLGITVTKKVGTAVERNRVKRVVREVFRCNRPWFPPSSDVVVIAKDGAPALTLVEATEELRQGMARLNARPGDLRPGRPPSRPERR